MYTVDELVAVTGVSRRSIYSYVERRILPPPIRQGRRQVYSVDHLALLRAIRLLGRMGVPMWQIERLITTREADAVRALIRPVEPVASQLDEAEQKVAEIRANLSRVPDQLDLTDLGLDDPIWLRRELARAERKVRDLAAQLQETGQSVLRRMGGGEAPPERPAVWDDRRLDRLERLVEDLASAILGLRNQERLDGFRAGLAAAKHAGWTPPARTPAPPDLSPEAAAAFGDFVTAVTSGSASGANR